VEGLCTAREPRPLGCRVYFCDPNYQVEGQRISEQGIRELKALADEQGLPWRYAPLHVFLREHLEHAKEHTLEEHSEHTKEHTLEEHSEHAKEQADSATQNSLASEKPHKISLPLTS
jgi:outer membrane lipopolysaccharide assembly protein LptE/RlpB